MDWNAITRFAEKHLTIIEKNIDQLPDKTERIEALKQLIMLLEELAADEAMED